MRVIKNTPRIIFQAIYPLECNGQNMGNRKRECNQVFKIKKPRVLKTQKSKIISKKSLDSSPSEHYSTDILTF